MSDENTTIEQDFPEITSAEELTAINVLKVEKVVVPMWQKTVYLRTMTSGEKMDMDWEYTSAQLKANADPKDTEELAWAFKRYRERLLVRVICNQKGVRILQDNQVGELSKLDSAGIEFLAIRAQKMNLIGDDQIERLAKNSESGQKDTSSTN
jgi:hypothetical protein